MATSWRSIKPARPAPPRLRRHSPASSGTVRFRPRFELVEDRTLLSTFLVTSTADTGPGSLRQAILDSNAATSQTNTIDFAIPGTGIQTISPSSPLPSITASVLIDGTTQPGFTRAPLISVNGHSTGVLSPLAVSGGNVRIRGLAIDQVAIDATTDALLMAIVHARGRSSPLLLLDSHGRVLVRSDGVFPSNPEDLVSEHLAAGMYELKVDSTSAGGQDSYTWTAMLVPSIPPFQPLPVGSYPDAIVTGDFNGDGNRDLVVANNGDNTVSVLLGNGDGTFQPQATYPVGNYPAAIVAGDFNGDGRIDLAVANSGNYGSPGTVSVLLGNGDGTFQPQVTYAVGSGADGIVAGDFTGDGHIDLAVANRYDNTVSVLLGNGDGTFQPQTTYAVGAGPVSVAAGDFSANGHLDLAVTDFIDNTVSVLLGNGDGTFQPQVAYPVGQAPWSIVVGDFRGNGHLDLAVADEGPAINIPGAMSVLLGNGDGTFQPHVDYPAGLDPVSIAEGDFTGQGRLDLAVADQNSSELSVFLGNGDGTFRPQVTYPAGSFPVSVVAGDFTKNGRLSLAVVDELSNSVSVLLGNGDGTFAPQVKLGDAAGPIPASAVGGDFTGNGRLDLAVCNEADNTVSVLLGNGDGTFQSPVAYAVGNSPDAIVEGDFNGDGRLDLAVANQFDGTVSVLLGNGDGTFQPQVTYMLDGSPQSIIAADLTGNGRLDLVTANPFSNDVSVLLGNGDGTFQPQVAYAVGWLPGALVAGDFAGNGHLDLAVANGYFSGGPATVSVLLGNGDGTFKPQVTFPVGAEPYWIVAGDFTGNGRLDLATANVGDNTVSVLLGNGDGSFRPPVTYSVGSVPESLVAVDFTGNGRLDLATANTGDDTVSVLLGNGDGTFKPQVTYPVGSFPDSIVASDFNGDGRIDLVTANADSNSVSVLLGNGDGTFADAGQFATAPHATPLLVDANGDGTDDVMVIDGHGNTLYRQGVPGHPGSFEPPVTINPGFPSRDIVWVANSDQGPVLASVDAKDDAVSLYGWRNGGFVRLGSLTTGRLPAKIVAADLSGDGWTDLVVRNAADGTLSVFLNNQLGSLQAGTLPFRWPVTLPVGIGVSDVQAIDTAGSGMLDLVVTNKLTGQVGVLRNLGDGTFGLIEPYRAGTGLSAVEASSGSAQVTSLEGTAGVAAGPFTTSGPSDLVTMNPGSKSLGVLAGLGDGRFANPVSLYIGTPGRVIRIADFNHDRIPDLAVLTADGVSIYLGDGKGGFAKPVTYDAGPDPTGLTIADLDHNGKPDLLVGNSYGDVLILVNQGDGTFRPYRSTDQSVALAVADLPGNGSKDVIYADQGLDRVVVDFGAGGTTVLGDHATGLLDPGAVKLADLNGDGIPDLIVANSGSNNVLIYPGLGNGQFRPAINGGHGYFVGTNPVGITVANLTGQTWANGQPRLDLVVADQGSNQVSILLNTSAQGGAITFNAGPRLNSGGSGPVSTVVGHFTGGPNQDILVTNSGSNNVALLPGVGGGFFNDQNPQKFTVGENPGPLFVGNFDGRPDLVTVNAGSNDLTLISDFMSADHVTSTISSGGTDPDTAFSFAASSGFDDLIVGNGGDGVLALFEGGDQGLTLTSSQTNPDLPSPSALVYAGLSGGQVQFYAATEGREAAALVALSLGGEIAPLASPASPATPVVAQLIPLQESSVTLVGTLLITTLPSNEADVILARAETEVAATVSQSSSAPVAPNQSVLVESRSDESGGGEELPAQPQAAKAQPETPAASWQRHVLGTDEAIERFDREHPDLFPPRRDNSPQTEKSQRPDAFPAPAQKSPGATDRFEATDWAIEHLADRPGGETGQQFIAIRMGQASFTSLTKHHEAGQEQRCDLSAAMALAATVAGQFYFGSAFRRTRARPCHWATGRS
jgi:hypothetical protein